MFGGGRGGGAGAATGFINTEVESSAFGRIPRLFPFFAKYGLAFIGGLVGMAVARWFEMQIPWYLKVGIDTIGEQISSGVAMASLSLTDNPLLVPAALILMYGLLRFFLGSYSRRLIQRVGIAVSFDLRQRMYSHLQKMGTLFFAKHPTGDLMARAINDIQLVRQFINRGVFMVNQMFFTAVMALYYLFIISPKLMVYVLIPLPLIMIVAYVMSKRIFTKSMAVQIGFADVATVVQENLNGIRTIQAQGQEDSEIRRFHKTNDRYAQDFWRLMRVQSLLQAFMPLLSDLMNCIVLGFGGMMVLNGEISVGEFVAFLMYLRLLIMAARMSGGLVTLWQRCASGTVRLFDVFDFEPEIQDLSTGAAPATMTGALEVKNLSFTYPETDVEVISDISMKVEAGQMVAILGRVGSGKSTLLKLMARLIDPPPGTVIYDGYDIRDYPPDVIRDQVALVPQDAFLFADTIRHNVAYDDPSREEENVWDAVDTAHLKTTIEEFSDQLETEIGERGVTLSGGQKQRSSLARGVIRDEPVLLLDDCFSSVDTETEEHILSRLKEVRSNKTTLMVSHRVSTTRHADMIIVLDAGTVAEAGTHAELVELGGIYASLEVAQQNQQLEEEHLAELRSRLGTAYDGASDE